MISIADALREEGIKIGEAKAEKLLAEANARFEEEREQERIRFEQERQKSRLKDFHEAILNLKTTGMSFKTCVETLKLSDEMVQGLITNFPELVSK